MRRTRRALYATGVFAALSLCLISCAPKGEPGAQAEQTGGAIDTAHNSKNSLDWAGIYAGVVPCADCDGISVQITLNSDETYQLSYKYLGKEDTADSSSGKFTWDTAGGTITLDGKNWPPHYKVGENRLIQLDMEGNPITGELADKYVLTKSN